MSVSSFAAIAVSGVNQDIPAEGEDRNMKAMEESVEEDLARMKLLAPEALILAHDGRVPQ